MKGKVCSMFSKRPSSSMNISSHKPCVTVAHLISHREWLVLEHLLSSDMPNIPMDDPLLSNAITASTVLHFAAHYQPPLRTISFLSQLYPISLESADAAGRFPVHVAAKYAATVDVIQFLILSNPLAAGIQDALGKTPMHYLAEYYTRNYSRKMSHIVPVEVSMLQAVQLLKTAAPKSVNLEDHKGINAIEYALEHDADIRVIKAMQRACRDDWRERSNGGVEGRKRHDFLAKDAERIAKDLQRALTLKNQVENEGRTEFTPVSKQDSSDGCTVQIYHRVAKSHSFVARSA